MSWSDEVEELARRRERAREMGGEERVARQHAAGRLTVRERIDALVDPGSFVELGALAGEETPDGFVPSGYVGGLKEKSLSEVLEKNPERVIQAAVKGMLPKSSLGRAMNRKLKVYSGPEHPHSAQNPEALAV